MILALALCLHGWTSFQAKPQVTWVKLEDSVPGSWSVKAVYPAVTGDTALVHYFNSQLKKECEARFYEAAFQLRRAPKGPLLECSVRAILSVSGERVASGLITVSRTGRPVELVPVTCCLNGRQALSCRWLNLVRADTSADAFASTLLLPALNDLRKKNNLPPATDVPYGLLEDFVVTQNNVCWIAPPGFAAKDATQIKVPIADVATWGSPTGPLGAAAPESGGPIPMKAVVTWAVRESLPPGCVLRIRLLRERGDEVPLAEKILPAKDPPMEVSTSFPGVKADPDDRFYLDVRVLSGVTTLFLNRSAIRIPALGWQTTHDISLEKEH